MRSVTMRNEGNFEVRLSNNNEENITTENNRQTALITRDREASTSSSFYNQFSSIFKKCCKLNFTERLHLVINGCVFFLLMFGVVKLVLGVSGVVNGQTAAVLAKKDDLYWAGIFLLTIGASSILCGGISLYIVIWKDTKSLKAKHVFYIGLVMLYILLFDVIICIMMSKFSEENFQTKVKQSMNETLKEKYGVGAKGFEEKWDSLQRHSVCCGATSYLDWLDSVWADEMKTSEKLPAAPLPLSCRVNFAKTYVCNAVSGIPIANFSSTQYLLLTNFTNVQVCYSAEARARTLDYIHRKPCTELYTIRLAEMMQTSMLCCIVFTVIDLMIILILVKASTELPNPQRVDVYFARP